MARESARGSSKRNGGSESRGPSGLTVRRVPLSALHLDQANARAHPERNMEAIKASLLRFSQAEPLVVRGAPCSYRSNTVLNAKILVPDPQKSWSELLNRPASLLRGGAIARTSELLRIEEPWNQGHESGGNVPTEPACKFSDHLNLGLRVMGDDTSRWR